jgi:large subunit ribosomal protein L9
MKVILMQNVPKVGKKYDIKNVSDGYAANFLIPQKFAVVATPEAERNVLNQKKQIDTEKKIHNDLLLKNLKALAETSITIAAKTNDKGHLFSGIHREQIAEELEKQARVEIPASYIHVEKPIKETGKHVIQVGEGDKTGEFTLEIVSL